MNKLEQIAIENPAHYTAMAERANLEGKMLDVTEEGEIILIQQERPELTYKEQRAYAYPSLEEQLDMIYWDRINGTKNWENLISNVKEAYPKP